MMKKLVDRFFKWLASVLPRRLIYWCAMRLVVHATTRKYSSESVPDLRAMDAVERWDELEEE